MDCEVTKAFIHNLDNYFAIVGLANVNQQACFASKLFVKSATVWICNWKDDLMNLTWPTIFTALQVYFRIADSILGACSKLANYKQTGQAMGYIDKMKCIAQKLQ